MVDGNISRRGPVPVFFEYVTNFALVDGPQNLAGETKHSMWPVSLKNKIPESNQLKIPTFQRKLEWTSENLEKLIETGSELLGTVVKAKIGSDPTLLVDGLQRFVTGTILCSVLYDRVLKSAGRTFPSADSYFQDTRDVFTCDTAYEIWQHNDIVLRNHSRQVIRDFYRKYYTEIETYVSEELNKPTVGEFAEKIHNLLRWKQVAVDRYDGFTTTPQLVNTFPDLNTTGEPLSKVALLRTQLLAHIEQIRDPTNSWNDTSIIEFENDFSNAFELKVEFHVKTLGLYLYQKFPDDHTDVFPNWNSIDKQYFDDLFSYIEKFNEAIKEKLPGTTIQVWKWPYLSELKEFPQGGKIPTCIVLWYYWRIYSEKYLPELKRLEAEKKLEILAANLGKTIAELDSDNSLRTPEEEIKASALAEEFMNGLAENHMKKQQLQMELDISEGEVRYVEDSVLRNNKENEIQQIETQEQPFPDLFISLPDFLGGDLKTTDELSVFLRGCYRSLFGNEIGKTGHVLDEMMSNSTLSLRQIANKMTGSVNDLSEPISERWFIAQATKKFTKEYSKRVFNACLLPDFFKLDEKKGTFDSITPISYDFSCMIYGKRAGTYQVDHLIPQDELELQEDLPGYDDGQRIVNFAPLDTNNNRAASASTCSLKLMTGAGTAGYYDNMLQIPHPYCVWLVNTHASNHQNQISSDRDPPAPQTIPELNHVSGLIETSNINRERLDQLFKILRTKL